VSLGLKKIESVSHGRKKCAKNGALDNPEDCEHERGIGGSRAQGRRAAKQRRKSPKTRI
jgi:hypothetical protein